ncbi:hypothetical protein JCGZ_24114 [Jatropha curcas]|uniref:Phospholipase A1 n=1 Tax=Jatropha curcas TaxID=180498 RepID=A0A067LPS4_JATCU|nr:phospholipase A1-II 4 [Jatropha curcas]KDP46905.1 hypothetical protein JCGZ_24114 [Jatropha curcas]
MAGTGLSVIANIADRWRELSGENNWEGLLDPLDFDLRSSILNYGDRAVAIGDAYNSYRKFKDLHGFSRYPPNEVFTKVGIRARNEFDYTVTDFIYSRLEAQWFDNVINESTWCAYVAVATDDGKKKLGRRDIVVSWRETALDGEKLEDYEFIPVSASDIFPNNNNDPLIHFGFRSIYTTKDDKSIYNKKSARDQVLDAVSKLVDQYKDEEVSITLTGHSLGSALATLNAVDIAYKGINKPTGISNKSFPVTAIVFGCPMVGNEGFKKVFDELSDVRVLRVENANDPVPKLPPNELILMPQHRYYHVGESLPIDTTLSPFLKTSDVNPHDLNVYLHGVAGTQGSKGGFNLEYPLDTALINKRGDDLNAENNYNIPPIWWVEENKGMVLQDDGTYKAEFYIPDAP